MQRNPLAQNRFDKRRGTSYLPTVNVPTRGRGPPSPPAGKQHKLKKSTCWRRRRAPAPAPTHRRAPPPPTAAQPASRWVCPAGVSPRFPSPGGSRGGDGRDPAGPPDGGRSVGRPGCTSGERSEGGVRGTGLAAAAAALPAGRAGGRAARHFPFRRGEERQLRRRCSHPVD